MSMLDQYEAIALADLGPAGLMGRVDTKFALPLSQLERVLEDCAPDYRALVVDGRRRFVYATEYFDTPGLAFYRARVAGRTPRRKVRVRRYVDIRDRYLEIKVRDNGGRTEKHRVPLGPDGAPSLAALDTLPREITGGFGARDLHAVLTTSFTRVTLVRKDLAERVTLDVGVEFAREGRSAAFPTVVFAEVKQAVLGWSPFIEHMRARHVRPTSLSKYCLALTALGHAPGASPFRATLTHLHRLDARDGSPAFAR